MGFAGASIPDQPFAGDDGSRAPVVQQAIEALLREEPVDLVAVLAGTRLLSALVAVLDEAEAGVEKESHLAAPYLTGQDGRRGNIAFTCVESAKRWDADARVVPATAAATAAAAIADGADALIIDPADPHVRVVDWTGLHRLAGGLAPLPDLTGAIGRALAQLGRSAEWDLVRGPEGSPLLLVDLAEAEPTATLELLAAVMGADPEVAERSPLGLDFGVNGPGASEPVV